MIYVTLKIQAKVPAPELVHLVLSAVPPVGSLFRINHGHHGESMICKVTSVTYETDLDGRSTPLRLYATVELEEDQ